MGFYLRKSFKAGPVRLNLSKSGLGVSTGVKGLRVGQSASGRSYVHAGRGGFYYRKSLGSGKRSGSGVGSGLWSIILIIIGIFIIVKLLNWIIQNPAVPIVFGVIAALVSIFYYTLKAKKTKVMTKYKTVLDNHFVTPNIAPNEVELKDIQRLKAETTKYPDILEKVKKVEQDVYVAVLDKTVEDQAISEQEKELIQSLESIISLDDDFRLETKKESFRLHFLEIIADHKITKDEADSLKNYISGLGLQSADIKDVLKVVKEIIRMQNLRLPLPVIDGVPLKLQKSETPHYFGRAKVLSRKKAKNKSNSEYEYSIRRDGQFVITNKRAMIVDEGTTRVDFKNIVDIDVDLDHSMIIISKDTSSVPVFVQTDEPLYSAKIMDLLK